MKGSFKNLFIVIMILVSLIGSSIQTKPADALAYPTNTITINLPTSPVTWSTVKLYDVWGYDASTYTVGEGTYTQSGTTYKRPLIYKNGSPWGSTVPGFLSSDWTAGDLRAIWGYNADTVYTVGHGKALGIDRPLIYKKNTGVETWSSSGPVLPGENEPGGWVAGFLEDVWGPSATVTYAVGYGNTELAPTKPLIYRTTDNGLNWSSILPGLPIAWNGYLYGIWGSSATDIYVVGYANTQPNNVPLIYHSTNGIGWTRIVLDLPGGWSNGSLYSIWGSATDGIYAVGSGFNGTTTIPLVYHSASGASWELLNPALPSGWTTASLTSVWGSDGTVYVTGYGSDAVGKVTPVMYRKTNSGWAATIPDMGGWNSRYMEGMWGSDANHVYLAGYGNTTIATGQPLLYYTEGDTDAPGNVTDLEVTPGKCNGSVTLTWTAPADDAGNNNSGPVDSYLVKTKNSAFADWSEGTLLDSSLSPVPAAPGDTQTMTVSGLTLGATYYFAVKAQDEQGLSSGNYATDPTPGPAQSSESASTWYISGVGGLGYGRACDVPVEADYNGDGKDDIAVFRPTNSTWYIRGVGPFVYGTVGDIPVVADYNGDGKDDIAVFRPTNSTWYIYGVGPRVYGTVGDIPVVADYNGDGKDDIAVFRPTNSTWYIYGVGPFVYGTVGDIPVVADYNGDGRADIAVFRPTNSTWYIYGVGPFVYGTVGDIPVVADYNGDGRADIAVFRPTNSTWYIYGVGPRIYGTVGDIPVVADYNGDGNADVAVFR